MTAEICPVNLGPRGRKKRLFSAVVMAVVIAVALVLVARNQPPPFWRLLFFLPLLLGALGIFQASAGT